jgi:hypothetical protein
MPHVRIGGHGDPSPPTILLTISGREDRYRECLLPSASNFDNSGGFKNGHGSVFNSTIDAPCGKLTIGHLEGSSVAADDTPTPQVNRDDELTLCAD